MVKELVFGLELSGTVTWASRVPSCPKHPRRLLGVVAGMMREDGNASICKGKSLLSIKIGIMEKNTETTRILYSGDIGIMEKKTATTIVYSGHIGIMEMNMDD